MEADADSSEKSNAETMKSNGKEGKDDSCVDIDKEKSSSVLTLESQRAISNSSSLTSVANDVSDEDTDSALVIIDDSSSEDSHKNVNVPYSSHSLESQSGSLVKEACNKIKFPPDTRISSASLPVEENSDSTCSLTGDNQKLTPTTSSAKSYMKSKPKKTPKSSAPEILLDMNDIEHLRTPFKYGWKREIVFRNTQDTGSKQRSLCDVYYFPPNGKKLRSMVDIANYLNKQSDTKVNLTHFTFKRMALFNSPDEVVRNAGQSTKRKAVDNAQQKVVSTKKMTPSVQKKNVGSSSPLSSKSSSQLVTTNLLKTINNTEPKILESTGSQSLKNSSPNVSVVATESQQATENVTGHTRPQFGVRIAPVKRKYNQHKRKRPLSPEWEPTSSDDSSDSHEFTEPTVEVLKAGVGPVSAEADDEYMQTVYGPPSNLIASIVRQEPQKRQADANTNTEPATKIRILSASSQMQQATQKPFSDPSVKTSASQSRQFCSLVCPGLYGVFPSTICSSCKTLFHPQCSQPKSLLKTSSPLCINCLRSAEQKIPMRLSQVMQTTSRPTAPKSTISMSSNKTYPNQPVTSSQPLFISALGSNSRVRFMPARAAIPPPPPLSPCPWYGPHPPNAPAVQYQRSLPPLLKPARPEALFLVPIGQSRPTLPNPPALQPSPTTLQPSPTTLQPSPTTLQPSPTTLQPSPTTLLANPPTLQPSSLPQQASPPIVSETEKNREITPAAASVKSKLSIKLSSNQSKTVLKHPEISQIINSNRIKDTSYVQECDSINSGKGNDLGKSDISKNGTQTVLREPTSAEDELQLNSSNQRVNNNTTPLTNSMSQLNHSSKAADHTSKVTADTQQSETSHMSGDEDDEFCPTVSFAQDPLSNTMEQDSNNLVCEKELNKELQESAILPVVNSSDCQKETSLKVSENSLQSKDNSLPGSSSTSCVPDSQQETGSNAQLLTLPSDVAKQLNLNEPIALKINGVELIVPPACIIHTPNEGVKVLLRSGSFQLPINPSSKFKVSVSRVNASLAGSALTDSSTVQITKYTRRQYLQSFRMLQSSFTIMSKIFALLPTPCLLRARCVCKFWNNFIMNHYPWNTVNLAGVYIKNWMAAAEFLNKVKVKKLSLKGVFLSVNKEGLERAWDKIKESLPTITSLEQLTFGRAPASVLDALTLNMPNLLNLSATVIIERNSMSTNPDLTPSTGRLIKSMTDAVEAVTNGVLSASVAAKLYKVSEKDLNHLILKPKNIKITKEEETSILLCCFRLSQMGFSINLTTVVAKCQEVLAIKYSSNEAIPILANYCNDIFSQNAPLFLREKIDKNASLAHRLEVYYSSLRELYNNIGPVKLQNASQVFAFDVKTFKVSTSRQSTVKRFINITALSLLSASQKSFPIMLIFPTAVESKHPDLMIAQSKHGLATSQLVNQYLTTVLKDEVNDPSVVLCNGNSALFSVSLLDYCMTHWVYLHYVPTDLAPFVFPGNLGGVMQMLRDYGSEANLDIPVFMNVLVQLLTKRKKEISNSMKFAMSACGVFPVNPKAPYQYQSVNHIVASYHPPTHKKSFFISKRNIPAKAKEPSQNLVNKDTSAAAPNLGVEDPGIKRKQNSRNSTARKSKQNQKNKKLLIQKFLKIKKKRAVLQSNKCAQKAKCVKCLKKGKSVNQRNKFQSMTNPMGLSGIPLTIAPGPGVRSTRPARGKQKATKNAVITNNSAERKPGIETAPNSKTLAESSISNEEIRHVEEVINFVIAQSREEYDRQFLESESTDQAPAPDGKTPLSESTDQSPAQVGKSLPPESADQLPIHEGKAVQCESTDDLPTNEVSQTGDDVKNDQTTKKTSDYSLRKKVRKNGSSKFMENIHKHSAIEIKSVSDTSIVLKTKQVSSFPYGSKRDKKNRKSDDEDDDDDASENASDIDSPKLQKEQESENEEDGNATDNSSNKDEKDESSEESTESLHNKQKKHKKHKRKKKRKQRNEEASERSSTSPVKEKRKKRKSKKKKSKSRRSGSPAIAVSPVKVPVPQDSAVENNVQPDVDSLAYKQNVLFLDHDYFKKSEANTEVPEGVVVDSETPDLDKDRNVVSTGDPSEGDSNTQVKNPEITEHSYSQGLDGSTQEISQESHSEASDNSSEEDSSDGSSSSDHSSSSSSDSEDGSSSSGNKSSSNDSSSDSSDSTDENGSSSSDESTSQSKGSHKTKQESTDSASSDEEAESSDIEADENEEESEDNDDSKCQMCMRSTPPHFKDQTIDWVDCDGNCGRWFHVICIIRSQSKADPNHYVCPSCKCKR